MKQISGRNLTAGKLRQLIGTLPDDSQIYIDWAGEPPGDADPAVELVGFALEEYAGKPALSVRVDLAYLDDIAEEEPEDDEEAE